MSLQAHPEWTGWGVQAVTWCASSQREPDKAISQGVRAACYRRVLLTPQ